MLLLAALLAGGPAPAAPRAGAAAVVVRAGGVYPDAELAGYVRSVGMRLAAAAGAGGGGWRFVVLDTARAQRLRAAGLARSW